MNKPATGAEMYAALLAAARATLAKLEGCPGPHVFVERPGPPGARPSYVCLRCDGEAGPAFVNAYRAGLRHRRRSALRRPDFACAARTACYNSGMTHAKDGVGAYPPGHDAIQPKTWTEFRDTGLLWFVNRMLHAFGWTLVIETDMGKPNTPVLRAFPARTTFRGFTLQAEERGFARISAWLAANAHRLNAETVAGAWLDTTPPVAPTDPMLPTEADGVADLALAEPGSTPPEPEPPLPPEDDYEIRGR